MAFDNIINQIDLICCPVCYSSLDAHGSSLVCKNAHCYNCNKKGWVNLIPSQQPTKYNNSLFEARRRILEDGFYNDLICSILPNINGTVLDVGCGDGYFTSRLKGSHTFGLDLSKEAIAIAAKNDKSIAWLIADATNIPLKDGSVDTILNILSPAHYPQFRRIIAKGGRVIKVIPTANYLQEIRNLLGKSEYSNQQVKSLFARNVSSYEVIKIENHYSLNSAQAQDFIAMTPLAFDCNSSAIDVHKLTAITISLEILIGTL